MHLTRLATTLLLAATLLACGTPGFRFGGQQVVTPVPPGSDAQTRELLAPYSEKLEPMRVVVGESDVIFSREPVSIAMGSWLADIVREAASKATGRPVDIGVMNWGGIRAGLDKGPVTRMTVMEIMPFDNEIVVYDLDASQLRALFAKFASKGAAPMALGGAELWAKDHEVTRIEVGGHPLDDSRRYTVALSSYLANGGDNLDILKTFPKPAGTRIFFRDAIAGNITALASQGRKIQAPPHPKRIHLK